MSDETKTVPFEIVCVGGKYRCTYINNYRVHGGKPYISEGPEALVRGDIDIRDLYGALVLVKAEEEVRNAIRNLKPEPSHD